jgi:quercetin dioxygenase-like cupin family protein
MQTRTSVNVCGFVMALASACSWPTAALADPPADVMNIVRVDEIKWVSNPLVPGLATAVVQGDPRKAGEPYVIRVKFPPNTFSPPHFHPEARYIVVLKGTWWVGSGPKWDKDATTPVPTGSFVIHHPNKIHYDGAKDEEVILQIIGVGPSDTKPVDEAGKPKS